MAARRASRPSARLVTLMGATTAVLVAGVGLSLACAGSTETSRNDPPRAPKPVVSIELPWWPGRLAVAGSRVWVGGRFRPVIARVDTAAATPSVASRTVPAEPNALLATSDAVWAAGFLTVFAIDPESLRVAKAIKMKWDPSFNLVMEGGLLWAANLAEGPSFVYRLAPRAGKWRSERIRVGVETVGVAAGAGSIWVVSHDEASVSRIDPRTGDVTAVISLPSEPHGIAYGNGGLWIANYHERSISRIDPRTNTVSDPSIPLPIAPDIGIAASGGSVWAVPSLAADREGADHRVVRIDARTRRVADVFTLAGFPQDVVASGENAWVTTRGPNQLVKLAPAE